MSETNDQDALNSRSIALRGVVAVIIAVLANALVLTAVLQTGAVPVFQPLNYVSVVVLTTVGVGGAAVVYWYLGTRRADPDPLFIRVATVALLVSFFPDLGLLVQDPTATLSNVAVLMAMHVVAAAVAVAVLTDVGR